MLPALSQLSLNTDAGEENRRRFVVRAAEKSDTEDPFPIDIPPSPMDNAAACLVTNGAVVLPTLSDGQRRALAGAVWAAIAEFPEYLPSAEPQRVQRVLGGFGAFGNPSSFHHPTMQQYRVDFKSSVAVPLMRSYAAAMNFEGAPVGGAPAPVCCEVLFDRICVRAKDFGAVGKESWHRDVYDHRQDASLRALPRSLRKDGEPHRDELFGGWTNLSDQTQRFVGILGSHAEPAAALAQERGGGFAQLSPQEIKDQDVASRLAQQAGRTSHGLLTCDAKGNVEVPPGHTLLFLQRLLHSVAGGPQPPEPQLRVFNGVRLCGAEIAMFDHRGVIENNRVPRIPSGQVPPMYSVNHYGFFGKDDKYGGWGARTFKSQCLFERASPAGVVYFTPGHRAAPGQEEQAKGYAANRGRYMPGLAEMGLPVYPYSAAAVRALQPEPL